MLIHVVHNGTNMFRTTVILYIIYTLRGLLRFLEFAFSKSLWYMTYTVLALYKTNQNKHFVPVSKCRWQNVKGAFVFFCLSVDLRVSLYVFAQTLTLGVLFLFIQERVFIFGVYSPWIKHCQTALALTTLWSWPWHVREPRRGCNVSQIHLVTLNGSNLTETQVISGHGRYRGPSLDSKLPVPPHPPL